ncbi:MAG: DUF1549 and DUF1553 domain-containing protein [Planctomycetaceae bacterium]
MSHLFLRLLCFAIAVSVVQALCGPGRADDDSVPSDEAISEYPISDSDRDHWAYQPIVRPKLPEVESVSWPQTEIDFFILHDLEHRGLSPSQAADRSTLLRRVHFDLLGLPPTPQQLLAFEQDSSPLAYVRLVDCLLASPAYGERWAQHWLDLARFAETDGFEHDKVRSTAWQYRQWVIDSLNGDMPYDQFIRLQLTADLTAGQQDVIATTFCLAGPDMPDINEQDLRRHDKLNEMTSTVGSVLLGLQLHCAQCHDHKYDPISQADFYRLRGIFESAIPELARDKPIVQLAAQTDPLSPRLYYRGELHHAGPILDAKPPRIACSAETYERFDSRHPRQAFSDWLFDADNPLVPRVIANRIWQHHFGKSLCENPSDFGVIASGPSHPELLDWLALELRDKQWSLKQLHRTILLSATYQQSSRLMSEDPESISAWANLETSDPGNEWYGRFPRRRLEGETIRDALLSVSGQLNHGYGGPSVMPPLPPELLKTLLPKQWQTSPNPADHVRRSIYLFARRNLRYPLFEVFDRPDAGASCAIRGRSTTAIQSLEMLNSELAFEAAAGLRDRLIAESNLTGGVNPKDAHAALSERLFLTALNRRPSTAECQRLVELLGSSGGDDIQQTLLIACMAVLNASEFIYID